MVYDRRSAPLCRYASIILLAVDAWLLTVLRNVVAYACRPSRPEDRRHVRHSALLCTPPARRPGFRPPGFAPGDRQTQIRNGNLRKPPPWPARPEPGWPQGRAGKG